MSSIFGSIFDYPMYFLLPLSLAVIASWGFGLQIILVVPALVVGYGIMLLSSQLVTLVMGAILQSRRFRDAMILFFSLVGISCAFINVGIEFLTEQVDFTQLEGVANVDTLFNVLRWTPAGAVAQTIRLAEMGQWFSASTFLVYAFVWLAAMGWLWFVLVERLLVGSGFLIQVGKKAEAEEKERSHNVRFGWIPDDIREFAFKELKMVWRTPSRRITLFQGLMFPAFLFIPMFTSGERDFSVPAWFGLTILGFAAFNQWTLTMNMLGFEGRGLPALMLMPFSRQRFFIGKSLGLAMINMPSMLFIGIVIAIINPHWTSIFSLLLLPAISLPITATGVISAVLFPTPVNLEKATSNPSMTRGGCLAGLVMGFVSPVVNALLVSPIIGGMVLAYFMDWWWLPMLIIIPVYLYSIFVFRWATRWAGQRMEMDAPEILAKAALPEDR